MAQARNQQSSNPWSEGFDKLTEAGRLNLTATSLAVAGAAAIGAAAVAYLWDEQRRRDFMDMTKKLGDPNAMTNMWKDWSRTTGGGGNAG